MYERAVLYEFLVYEFLLLYEMTLHRSAGTLQANSLTMHARRTILVFGIHGQAAGGFIAA